MRDILTAQQQEQQQRGHTRVFRGGGLARRTLERGLLLKKGFLGNCWAVPFLIPLIQKTATYTELLGRKRSPLELTKRYFVYLLEVGLG